MAEGSQVQDQETAREVSRQVQVTPKLVLAIVGPYVLEKILAQVVAVLPLSLFLFLFQLLALRKEVTDALTITAGLFAVILGLMFFMDGLRLGLMPLGENIGSTLPAKASLKLVLGFAFVAGVMATFAEPAICTLKAAGANVQPEQAPLLFEMLNRSSGLLVSSVAVGVGIATVLGIYRFVRKWSLRVFLFPTLAVTLLLTVVAAPNPSTQTIVALAWIPAR